MRYFQALCYYFREWLKNTTLWNVLQALAYLTMYALAFLAFLLLSFHLADYVSG